MIAYAAFLAKLSYGSEVCAVKAHIIKKNIEYEYLLRDNPYKKDVIKYCHTLTPEAQKIGAVNNAIRDIMAIMPEIQEDTSDALIKISAINMLLCYNTSMREI